MARGWPQEACRNRRRAGLPELLRRDERWRRTPRLHPRLSKACFGVDAGPASGGGEMRVQWVRQSAAAPAAATTPPSLPSTPQPKSAAWTAGEQSVAVSCSGRMPQLERLRPRPPLRRPRLAQRSIHAPRSCRHRGRAPAPARSPDLR